MSSVELAQPSGRAGSLWTAIRRDVGLLAAGNVVVLALQLAFRAVLVVALLPVDYGRLSLVLAVYNTIWIVGASGVPSVLAREVALIAPGDDRPVLRAALIAALAPVAVSAVAAAVVSGLLLESPSSALLAGVGLAGLIYSLLAMGILRGRGRVAFSATVMPVTAAGELLPLLAMLAVGVTITPADAFASFCAGNVVGLAWGAGLVRRTMPGRSAGAPVRRFVAARELLGTSAWLAAATLSVAALPLLMRSAAALDSYAAVAVVDIAILALALPQRLGTVVLFAVVPHAARGARRGERPPSISWREHLIVIPFLLLAVFVWTAPASLGLARLSGHAAYASAGAYVALALVAGPARILYGLAEGILIALGHGRFLAAASFSASALAAPAMFAAAAAGSTILAFAVFVVALWSIYLLAWGRLVRAVASS